MVKGPSMLVACWGCGVAEWHGSSLRQTIGECPLTCVQIVGLSGEVSLSIPAET